MISEFITPQVPLIPGLQKLPPLDQIAPPAFASPVLIFRVKSEDARKSIIEDLQDGLAKTIEEMPFIAADVIPENVDRGTIQLEIKEGAGIWFYINDLPDLEFEALERRKFAPAALPFKSLVPEPRQHSFVRSPVLTIQGTFVRGGLLLVSADHPSFWSLSRHG
jgi:trichothecene 3-O-acetyltransferase